MAKLELIKRDFSCGGLVWDDEQGKVLLVYVQNLARKKVWTFPKGHPHRQEMDEEAAIREVKEETGWRCEIEKPLMDVQYSYFHKGIKVNKTVRWFLMRPVAHTNSFQEGEILDCKWADLDETRSLISYDSDIKLLKRLALMVV